MSGRVATIAYIKEPTVGAYGTNFISSPCGPDVRLSLGDSQRLKGSEVEENLDDHMLELSMTRLM